MNMADAIRQASQAPRALTEAPSASEGLIELRCDSGSRQAGTVVRLELTLGPEQLAILMRSVLSSQHSVLTAREAAGLLRVTPQRVEQMATQHELPGFQIDGKWRFSRTAIEEWMADREQEASAS